MLLILSMPPARKMLLVLVPRDTWFHWMACEANMTDFMPLAHTLLTVVQMELMGILPEPSTACRQGACPIPADTTFPKKASFGTMFCGSNLLKAPWMATLPNCGAVRLESDPRNLPIGVLANATITAALPDMF
jgi:hypothetical protein